MEDHENRTGLGALTQIWARRKWVGLLLFAAPFAGMVTLAQTLPNLYSSAATVLVEQQQIPEGFVKSSVTGESDTRLHLIREKLLNRSSLNELIARFDLYPEFRKQAPEEAVVDRMRNWVGVRPAACTSLTRGNEILPSGRTGTVRLMAVLFQTEISSTSSGPMR